jgi:LPS sulfotransferase NodH
VPDLIQSVFPNLTYITVSRRDKVRQAVSLWRALQTWSWSSDQNADRAAGDRLTYSHAAIAHLIRDIEDHEFGWRAFFRECGVEPFDVVYEDFAGRYEDTIRDILRHLGLPEADEIAIEQPTRRKQADDLSRRWAERYKAESSRFLTA